MSCGDGLIVMLVGSGYADSEAGVVKNYRVHETCVLRNGRVYAFKEYRPE